MLTFLLLDIMTALSAAPSYRGRPFSVHSRYNVWVQKNAPDQNRVQKYYIFLKLFRFFLRSIDHYEKTIGLLSFYS